METKVEIGRVIANGCAHKWMPIWWRPGSWLNRKLDGPTEKFFKAGYQRAFKCIHFGCGLAYLAANNAVVPIEE